MLPLAAHAGVVTAVNRARAGCGAGMQAPLRRDARLARVAQLLATGEPLAPAERDAGYRAERSWEIRVSGATSDRAIAALIGRHFCRLLTNPALRAIGVYRRGSDVWIAVAEPFTTPPARDAAGIGRRVLELTNRARARGRRCGARWFPQAPPLSLSSALTRAALAHSADMARNDFLRHHGSDGTSPGERVTRAGYRWDMVGENIESGVETADQAVAGWLSSPHHCANIMTAGFRAMGVAFAVNRATGAVIYWTQDFAAPRRAR